MSNRVIFKSAFIVSLFCSAPAFAKTGDETHIVWIANPLAGPHQPLIVPLRVSTPIAKENHRRKKHIAQNNIYNITITRAVPEKG
jgi:hypothetical protein